MRSIQDLVDSTLKRTAISPIIAQASTRQTFSFFLCTRSVAILMAAVVTPTPSRAPCMTITFPRLTGSFFLVEFWSWRREMSSDFLHARTIPSGSLARTTSLIPELSAWVTMLGSSFFRRRITPIVGWLTLSSSERERTLARSKVDPTITKLYKSWESRFRASLISRRSLICFMPRPRVSFKRENSSEPSAITKYMLALPEK